MDDLTKGALDDSWRRRCALHLIGQLRFETALQCFTKIQELSADAAYDLHTANALRELAERRWIRDVLKYAGNVKIRRHWDAGASDFIYELGNGLVFAPVFRSDS